MLDPIYLENDQVIVHAFGPEDVKRYEALVKDIYQLFSDPDTLRFIPEKRLRSVQEADSWLKNTILNFHCDRNFLHFVTDKKSGKLLGMIDILHPARSKSITIYPGIIILLNFTYAARQEGKRS
ncbi:hypothetical protein ABDD95_19255 [Mucilaginibacter sp. PAMB04274]|uniref:hypothetical protein n=1 Tax=Mucilaginibacter sp. PAMB04274 TaxID=3138568 RepID=UPI0031F63BF3